MSFNHDGRWDGFASQWWLCYLSRCRGKVLSWVLVRVRDQTSLGRQSSGLLLEPPWPTSSWVPFNFEGWRPFLDWEGDSLHPVICLVLRRTCPSTRRPQLDCFSTPAAVISTECTLAFLPEVVCPLQDSLGCFALGLIVVSEHRYSLFGCLGCCSFEQVRIGRSHSCYFSSEVFCLYLLQDWWLKPRSWNFKHLEKGAILIPDCLQNLTILSSSCSSVYTRPGQHFAALDRNFSLSTLTFHGYST